MTSAASRIGVTLALAVAFTLALGLLPPVPAIAQQPGLRIESFDTGDHPDVRLTVTAPVHSGDIRSEHFALLENGQRRSVSVRPVDSGRLDVVLLMDSSGSMKGAAIDGAREAARTFVERIPASANVALVTFATQPHLASPFGAPREQLLAAIDGLVASGETALYDAVGAALDTFAPAADGRQVVVLLSDGGDTVSRAPLDHAVARLAAADATLTVVELATTETDRPALDQLAAAGDGPVLSTADPAALVAVYQRIAADLVNRYELAYTSGAGGATDIRVELALPDGGQLAATGRFELPAPPAPRLRLGELLVPGWLASRWGMIAGIAALYVAAALIALAALAPRAPRSTLSSRMPRRERATPVAGLATRATEAAERGLQNRQLTAAVNEKLENAGVNLRPGEFVVLVLSAMATGLAVGALLAGPLTGLVLAAVVGLLARMGLGIAVERRQARFADQLGDTLQLLAGSLRAGHSLLQAVDSVATEAEAPTSEEFRRLVVETRLGRSMEVSLGAMARRMGSEDFEWVAQAIAIHREVGGDLADVLDNVSATIRERNQVRRQVKALTAEGRLSAYVLLALPFGVSVVMFLTNPEYLAVLFQAGVGRLMLMAALGLMATGALWLRKIVQVVF
jgi:tight adherence protein B